MSSDEPVRACICFPHTFAEIKSICDAENLSTVEQITEATGCGGGCGHCRPYLKEMLKTGRTAFAILPEDCPEEDEWV